MAKNGFFKTLKAFSFAAAIFAGTLGAALSGALFASCENFSGGDSANEMLAFIAVKEKKIAEERAAQEAAAAQAAAEAAKENQNAANTANAPDATNPDSAQAADGAVAVGQDPFDCVLTACVSLPGFPSLAGNAPLPESVARYADVSLSALPGANNLTDAATASKYSFSATLAQTGAGGQTYTADGVYDSLTSTCSFSFGCPKSASAASYTLTVNLKYDDSSGTPKTVASGSQSVTVAAGATTFSASVTLVPDLTSSINGKLSLPIQFSDTLVTSLKVELIDSTGADKAAAYLQGGATVSLSSGSGTITSAAIPGGTYKLLMTFYKNTRQVGFRTESINVYPSMTTNLWWTNGTAGSALNIAKFDQTEFWIRGTDGVFYTTTYPGAKAANDTNIGSWSAPLKTIQAAVDKISSDGDALTQYTIIVDGKVSGEADADYSGNNGAFVNVAAVRKITFKGWTGPAKDIIDANKSAAQNARAIYINDTQKIILQDIAVTGGYAGETTSNSSNGGGIYAGVGADIELKNAKISGCVAGTDGGGIYLSGSSAKLVLDNSIIEQNDAQTYGGGLYISGSATQVELDNCVIKENSVKNQGGGAYIASGAKLTMNGSGSLIKSNKLLATTAPDGPAEEKVCGGGVYVGQGATFTMNAGTIRENGFVVTDKGSGGGVFLIGTFDMKGGTVSSNGQLKTDESYDLLAVRNIEIGSPGTFNLYDGTITNDITISNYLRGAGVNLYVTSTYDTGKVTFNMSGGTICGLKAQDGGGVRMNAIGTGCSCEFNMSGGTISGNEATMGYNGGGVYVGTNSVFNFTAGTISGNTSTVSSGGASGGQGGGIYISAKSGSTSAAGKCYISGSALIGQDPAATSSAATSANGSHSNKAKQGGGIYNKGELYLGYTDASTPESWTGAICYNYATSDGGSVYSNSSSAVFKMSAGSVCYNYAASKGGGIYLSSAAKFAMSGGSISGNKAEGKGGAVYLDSSSGHLDMEGDAIIPPGTDGSNDVDVVGAIEVVGALTATETPVATITPNEYTVNRVVLKGSALTPAECAKFALTQPSGAVGSWSIKFDSATTKGVLKQLSIVYVSSPTLDPSSSVPAGSDSGDGSIEHPYATFYKAAQAFSEKAAAIGGTAAAPEFENKIYLLSDLTYTTGAGLDGENAYNVEIIGCKDGVVGDKVKLILNTPTHDNSGFYVNQKHKIKFTNIDITQTDTSQPNDYAAVMVGKDSSNTGECWLEDCTIKGLYAKKCSAIAAEGDVYLKNVEISGNKTDPDTGQAKVFGPAVNSTTGTVKIIGKVIIQNNTMKVSDGSGGTVEKEQNLWIGGDGAFMPITPLGAIDDTKIGVTLTDNSNTFTAYFSAAGSGANPADFFTSDEGLDVVFASDGINAKLQAPTTIHVGGITGNDLTGNGSFLRPYGTIEKAVARINELNNSSASYIIKIASPLALPQHASVGDDLAAASLAIKGDSATVPVVSGGPTETGEPILWLDEVKVPVTIENIEFKNGKLSTSSAANGGAILAENCLGAITVTDCKFTSCEANGGNGGAIYLDGGTLSLSGNEFTSGKAKNGGAIYVKSGTLQMASGTISGNTATSNGGGVSVVSGGTFAMSGGTISGNSAGLSGGGICNEGICLLYKDAEIGNSAASGTATSDTNCSNKADYNGGGIYNGGKLALGYKAWASTDDVPAEAAAQTLNKGVYYNHADNGGGIYNANSATVCIASGNVSKNMAASNASGGGGICNYGASAKLFVSGGTIGSNKAYKGGGVFMHNGAFEMTGGEVSGNTATGSGGGVYTDTAGSALKLGGAASIPLGTTNNDVYLNSAITILSGLTKAAPVAAITPSAYAGATQVLSESTAGLVAANYNKFAVTQPSGATNIWKVTSTGYLAEAVSGGGAITIHTPEGDLNLAASADEITTSSTDTTVTISATDAAGTDITASADVVWNGVTVYYGADEIDTATGNSYKFLKAFPKGTYRLNVSVTYKGTTYSDSFTVRKTVNAYAAVPADFKKITAGNFKRAASSGATPFTVTISNDFYMCEHEVTQSEYAAVMGSNPSSFSGGNLPVENVNWYQAIAYCNKRSVADGLTPCYSVSGVTDWEALAFASIPTSDDSDWNAASYNPSADGYRLPTEAEWEYAALGTYKGNANWNGYGSSADASAIVFSGYNGSNSVDSYAWYGDSSGNTHAVKGKSANSNGLYDMSGNVWEWCWDWNGDYASANVTDPTGASTGSSRVNRGGGWFDVVDCCSVACQGGYSPYDHHYSLGFRVVRNAP